MQITALPNDFQPLYKGALVSITANPVDTITVTIYGDAAASKIVGTKGLRSQSQYLVNVAPYLYGASKVSPCQEHQCGAYFTDHAIPMRIMLSSSLGRTISDIVKFTPGSRSTMPNIFMSDAPRSRIISPGESDEVSVIVVNTAVNVLYTMTTTDGTIKTHKATSVVGDRQIAVVTMISNQLSSLVAPKKLSTIDMLITVGEQSFCRKYIMGTQKDDATTLKWINSYGGVDCYTFNTLCNKTFTVTKERIFNDGGYRVVSGDVDKVTTIASDFESPKVIDWLCEIISSPKVWVYSDGLPTQVDILDTRAVSSRGELSRIELTMKPTLSDPIQLY